jgi:hypothetical protein
MHKQCVFGDYRTVRVKFLKFCVCRGHIHARTLCTIRLFQASVYKHGGDGELRLYIREKLYCDQKLYITTSNMFYCQNTENE